MRVIEEKAELTIPRDGNRSKGLHLSEIIRDYALVTKVLGEEYDTTIEESNTLVLVWLGLAFENMLAAYQHPEIHFHPGEVVHKGIAMSPDGLSFASVDVGWMLHEFKLTLKSSRGFRESLRMRARKVLMYLWQIMCYRYALNCYLVKMGEKPCLEAMLHVMFLRGNYGEFGDKESLPTYKIFRLVFTQEELDENWALFEEHARSSGRLVEG